MKELTKRAFYYFPRADGEITVSKTESLPDGDFWLTEYIFPTTRLWFIDHQQFTPEERELAYFGWIQRTTEEEHRHA